VWVSDTAVAAEAASGRAWRREGGGGGRCRAAGTARGRRVGEEYGWNDARRRRRGRWPRPRRSAAAAVRGASGAAIAFGCGRVVER
jgi:hypothetical protein